MPERVIFHCDCNSFYASVELLEHPELRDLPVAVSGSVDDRHGIILAKNEAAKKYGVQTAETVWQAKRKCPDLIMLPPHHRKYRHFSHILNEYYESYTDRVEPFGIDESWLDMSGSWQLFGASPWDVAEKLRLGVKEKTGLTVSIGISFNKVFAKLGSDYKKPDAVTEITRDNYREIIWPLPATDMLFVGKKSQQTLENLGIKTIGDLAAADKSLLTQTLGKQGAQLWQYARGEDDAPVAGQHEPVKSIGNGMTFRRDLLGRQDVRVAVGALADEVASRLRRKKLYASNLQVLIKNPELKSISRQRAMPYATNLAKDLVDIAMELIKENWDFAKPIRMLTLTAQHLSDMPYATQTNLFGEEPGINAKREKLEKSLDKIRERYGKTAVVDASILHNDLGFETGAKIETDDAPKPEGN